MSFAVVACIDAFLQQVQRQFQAIGKQIRHGPEPNARMSLQDLRSSTRAPPTTADQGDLQHLVARGVNTSRQRLLSYQRRRRGDGCGEEVAS